MTDPENDKPVDADPSSDSGSPESGSGGPVDDTATVEGAVETQSTGSAGQESTVDTPGTAAEAEVDQAKAKAEAAAKAKAAAEAKAAKAKALAEAEAAKEPWERDPQTPEWEEAEGHPLVGALQASHPGSVITARTFAGDLVIEVEAEAIRDLCSSLKTDHGYKLLVDNCGAHYEKREEKQLEIVYILHNLEVNEQVRLKVRVDPDVEVPSVTPVFAGANWTERETYDMYGIRFAGHPDMTRILLWEGFNGFPLLKDFPVEGIDTGAAIYPESYGDEAGPFAGTGTGWKPPAPPEPAGEEPAENSESESPEGESS